MSSPITFFEKNFIDLDRDIVTITASNNDEFIGFVRNRSLRSGWVSTESDDEDEITIEFDLGDYYLIDHFILLDHNLKSYKLQAEDPDTESWNDVLEVTEDAKSSTYNSFSEITARRLMLTMVSTQEEDDQKRIARILVTKKIGALNYWPKIEDVRHNQGRVIKKFLSGKSQVLRNIGGFEFSVTIPNWRQKDDLELLESLWRRIVGFEVSIGGGDEDQFFFAPEGYRASDVYLMSIADDYEPVFREGIYVNGLDLAVRFVEVNR